MARPPARPTVRRSRGERRATYALKLLAIVVLSALILGAVLDFIGRVSSVAVILVGAVFFTYVIYPPVRRLTTRLPLIWSILVVYAAIVLIAAFGLAFIVPAFYGETQSLVRAMPQIVHNAQAFVTDPKNPLVAHLPASVRDYLAKVPAQLVGLAGGYVSTAAASIVGLALSVAGLLATLVVIPIVSVYLLIEAPDAIRTFARALPAGARPEAMSLMHDLDAVLAGFIRGQLLVGAVIGTCITIALLLLHVKYAVLIGVMAGVFDIIPYVGAIVGFVPAVSLAFFNDGWQHALIVALVFAAIFQAEGHFISPRIVSHSVGLSPLTVIVAILIGADLLGIAGMFLAVPLAAMLRVVLMHTVPGLRASAEQPVRAEEPDGASRAPAKAASA